MTSEHKITYEDLLRRGQEQFQHYEEVRDGFPPRVNCYCEHDRDDAGDLCAWCAGKEAGVDHTTHPECPWCLFHLLMSVNDTGIEPCLKGKHLATIRKLNRYMYTVASTNRPCDEKYQHMFVGCYVPQSLADMICAHFTAREEWHQYLFLVYDPKTQKVTRAKTSGEPRLVDVHIDLHLRGVFPNKFPDCLQKTMAPLFDADDRLVYMLIEDPVQERRTLYEELLSLFESRRGGLGKRKTAPAPASASASATGEPGAKRRRLIGPVAPTS